MLSHLMFFTVGGQAFNPEPAGWVARWIYGWTDPPLAFFLLYLFIVVFMVLAYFLGFALKLPILKQALIVVLLLLGCLIMAFMAYEIPIADILIIIVAALTIVRLRQRRYKET